MKKALIGVCDNAAKHSSKIKVWASSFKKHCSGPVILILVNPTSSDIAAIENLEITIVCINHTFKNVETVNDARLQYVKNVLTNINAEIVLVTDVFDVVFQDDPFKQLDIDKYDVFVSGEGILTREEPWNTYVLNTCFPAFNPACLDQEVICSGVIAGKTKALIALYSTMQKYLNLATDKYNIRDQAALQLAIVNNEVPNLKVFNLDEAWTVHCAVAGPTDLFTAWDFKRNIAKKYSIPKMVNGKVVTDTKHYAVVHQFNRVPDWHLILTKGYE